jgi:hypothetical protein
MSLLKQRIDSTVHIIMPSALITNAHRVTAVLARSMVMALPGHMYQLPQIQHETTPLANMSSHHRAITQQNKYK